MKSGFLLRLHLLFAFCFGFLFFLRNSLYIDFLGIFIFLYGFLLIPGKTFFSNQIKGLMENFSFKNIFSHTGIYVFFLLIIFSIIISWNIEVFLLTMLWIFLMIVPVSSFSLFSLSLAYFIGFLSSYYFQGNSSLYTSYLTFFYYTLIGGIVYYFFGKYLVFSKIVAEISLMVGVIFFIVSLYIPALIAYLPILLTVVFYLQNSHNYQITMKKNFIQDTMMIGLFFIIFIPLVNNYMAIENKNNILLLGLLVFVIFYLLGKNFLLSVIKK